MEVHGYTESGSIEATINELRMTIPNTQHDRDRWGITAWEKEGNVIPEYVPPLPPELNPETILREAMFEDFVERSAKNASTPKAIKDAALALKAQRK